MLASVLCHGDTLPTLDDLILNQEDNKSIQKKVHTNWAARRCADSLLDRFNNSDKGILNFGQGFCCQQCYFVQLEVILRMLIQLKPNRL